MSYSNRPLGPLGIDPLYFSLALFGCLFLFVIYLLLPRAVRVQYFDAYPKRYAWSARPRRLRMAGGVETTSGSVVSAAPSAASSSGFSLFGRKQSVQPIGGSIAASTVYSKRTGGEMEETVEFHGAGAAQSFASHTSDEAAIQNVTSQLRSQGVTIVAHGSRGKPKTVRLQLTNDSITWRTETKRKNPAGSSKEIKLGKVHSVALSNIMYVDVGKQTTALRRPENASVPESLCFSLLTKEGSLDLEAKSPRERDALVGSFSLILDNVHAQNWRDIYRNSNDMPSSFDEYDEETGVGR